MNYEYDPIPTWIEPLIVAGKLIPFDELVLKLLLRFRPPDLSSCWAAKESLASALGVHPKTVQRSLARLVAAGVIQRRPVPRLDPEAPANRTGWRFDFPWIEEA